MSRNCHPSLPSHGQQGTRIYVLALRVQLGSDQASTRQINSKRIRDPACFCDVLISNPGNSNSGFVFYSCLDRDILQELGVAFGGSSSTRVAISVTTICMLRGNSCSHSLRLISEAQARTCRSTVLFVTPSSLRLQSKLQEANGLRAAT